MKTLTEFFMDTYFMPVLLEHMNDRFFTGNESSIRAFDYSTPELRDQILWTTTISIATKASGYSVYVIYVCMDSGHVEVTCKDAHRLDKPIHDLPKVDYSSTEKINDVCQYIVQVIDLHQSKSQAKIFKDYGNAWFHRKFDKDLCDDISHLLEPDPADPYKKKFKPQAEWKQEDVPAFIKSRLEDEIGVDHLNLKSPAMEIALCIAQYTANYYQEATNTLDFYKRKIPGILKHCTTFGALIKHLNSSKKKVKL